MNFDHTRGVESRTLIAIMGPTASGKTDLAEELARRIGAQLINADAFHVYRGFDIGTAKPLQKDIYELIDIREPHEAYGVGEYVLDAVRVLERVFTEDRHAIVVGGTGFYVRALFEEYADMKPAPSLEIRMAARRRLEEVGLEALAEELQSRNPILKLDWKNPVRVLRALEKQMTGPTELKFQLPPFRKLKFGIIPETNLLNEKIRERVHLMLDAGWVQEVKRLLELGVERSAPAMRAIGYQTVADHLDGCISLQDMIEKVVLETIQYAKKQRTWLRKEPNLRFIEGQTGAAALAAEIEQVLKAEK